MAQRQRIFTLHGTSRDYAHTYGTFLCKDGLEIRDVSASDLGNPDLSNPLHLFHAAHSFAKKQGFVGGYPTFHSSGNDYNAKHRIALLTSKVAEFIELPEKDFHEPLQHDLGHYLGQFHHAARQMRPYRATGYPPFHVRTEGEARHHGGVFIHNMIAVHVRVFEHELGYPMVGDVVGHIREMQDFAAKKGFALGMFNGYSPYPEAEVFHHFHHHGMRNMVENEGWRVAQIVPYPPTVDGQGCVHYVATFLLTKDE